MLADLLTGVSVTDIKDAIVTVGTMMAGVIVILSGARMVLSFLGRR